MAIERRVCPLRGRTVILDPSRVQGPLPWPSAQAQIPLPELPAILEGEGIQVVANPRPLLIIEAPSTAQGLGANEVILHGAAPLLTVLRAVQARAEDLARDPRLQHSLWIWERGHGRVPQAHSQLFVSPEPWPGRAWDWDALEAEWAPERSLDGVLLPSAPQLPFEAWILDAALPALAQRTQAWLARMDQALGVPLTLCWEPRAQHSLLSVQPRMRPQSGLSLAGGVAHHGVPSELAVALLRQAQPELP